MRACVCVCVCAWDDSNSWYIALHCSSGVAVALFQWKGIALHSLFLVDLFYVGWGSRYSEEAPLLVLFVVDLFYLRSPCRC